MAALQQAMTQAVPVVRQLVALAALVLQAAQVLVPVAQQQAASAALAVYRRQSAVLQETDRIVALAAILQSIPVLQVTLQAERLQEVPVLQAVQVQRLAERQQADQAAQLVTLTAVLAALEVSLAPVEVLTAAQVLQAEIAAMSSRETVVVQVVIQAARVEIAETLYSLVAVEDKALTASKLVVRTKNQRSGQLQNQTKK
jgi:hypothetical protein